uniref:Serum opacity factor n=1 Tax=Brugia pahangi TaxID=6280 RepID=A0A0N4TDW0_BRUPA
LQDKTKDEDDAEEKSDSESVTGEQSTKFLREVTSIDQPESNTVGSSLKQHKIPAKINDTTMKTDEKMNDGSFIFDMQDKTKDEDDAEEKSDSESVTGEQSTKFLREVTSIDQPESNTVGSSLKQHKIPAKINDTTMKTDEKMNDGSFIFDMQVLIN